MSAPAAPVRKRKRILDSNKYPGVCYRCHTPVDPREGDVFEGPLRLVCAACSLREDVRDDNGLSVRMAQLPLKSEGKEYDLLPFQVDDCRRIASTRAVLIGSQMGTGKCHSRDTLVQINGMLIRSEDAWLKYSSGGPVFDGEGYWSVPSEPLFVNSIDDRGRIVRRQVARLYRQRVKEVLNRVRLRDGSEVSITRAHKLMGPLAWTNDIKPGDRVCVPARLPHESGNLDLNLAELFGWMVGDGHERSESNRMVFTQKCGAVRRRVDLLVRSVTSAHDLVATPRIKGNRETGRVGDVRTTSRSFRSFCESNDYPWGTLSADRRVPGPVMRGNASVVRTFLRSYMDADGSVPADCRYVEYSSASQRLAKEVAALLRRFGVWVRIRKKRARATNSEDCPYRDYWIGSFGGPSARRYRDEVGFSVGYKQDELNRLCSFASNSNTEGVPASALVAGIIKRSRLPASWFGLDPKHGLSTVYLNGTQEFSRQSLGIVISCMEDLLSGERGRDYLEGAYRRKELDEALSSVDMGDVAETLEKLDKLITKEAHYPKVVSVEEVPYDGWVYDLEVEGDHNYVAEGVLCHNTVQAAMASLRSDMPNFVFSPASVRENWGDEIKRWRPGLIVKTIESQVEFRSLVKKHLIRPGHVLIGSFGVLPGSPCGGCRGLRARLKKLKKWKEDYCPNCDVREDYDEVGDFLKAQRTLKVDGKCLPCGSEVMRISRPRYGGTYPQCTHFPAEGESERDRELFDHPPYTDLRIDKRDLRLPYHASGEVDDWIAKGVQLPSRGRIPEWDVLAPRAEDVRCKGCSQPNPFPVIDRKVVVVVDECHAFKTPGNMRTRNWRGFRERVWAAGGYVFGLTGTPCEGKPKEFWHVLESLGLARAAFGNWENYERIFKHWFSNPKGERLPPMGELREELHWRLRRIQINRRRKDVLSQLPPRTEVRISVEISDKTIHEVNEAVHRMIAVQRAWKDVQAGVLHNGRPLGDPFKPGLERDERDRRRMIYNARVEYYFRERPWTMDEEIAEAVTESLLSKGQMPTIDELSRIRSMLSKAKVAAVKEWIEAREEEGEPVVLFSQHVSILRKIAGDSKATGRPGWSCFHGGLTGKRRSVMVKAFQSGEIERGLAVSIGAGGEGITLTRAAVCAFIDLSWNPAKNHQAESRLIRIGAEQHNDKAADLARDLAKRGDFSSCAAEHCHVDRETDEVMPCVNHQARITVVRFVAKHVVDELVMQTLEEKESLLEALEWDEEEAT